MPEIKFTPTGRACQVDLGTTILEAARAHSVGLANCCGGQALCTTCRVVIESGVENLSDIADHEYDMLDLLRIGPSYRLACQTRVYGDVVVRVPA